MSDQTIQCVECGRKFIWSYGEQRYYHARQLEPPKHCPDCRSHRRNERESGMTGAPAYRNPATARPRAAATTARPATSARASGTQWQSWWPNPYKLYGVTAVLAILFVTGLVFIASGELLFSYLIGVNLVAFLMYGLDKLAAQVRWLRVPERLLIAPVWLLGFVGAEFGRRVFHHKTSDVEFRIKYWIAVSAQIALIAVYFAWIKS